MKSGIKILTLAICLIAFEAYAVPPSPRPIPRYGSDRGVFGPVIRGWLRGYDGFSYDFKNKTWTQPRKRLFRRR